MIVDQLFENSQFQFTEKNQFLVNQQYAELTNQDLFNTSNVEELHPDVEMVRV